ncbi:hypothetical protein T4E_2047 [Trichinella pseudospiralis]|uniref:Uncharacterized protein n=1 Tax=Trichinella pseudospiralis TaxID=6337 RepID=A0A0V0YI80_TRIPS|nr:hypothetical protein T4E_2047 [Trichinella pseudospiralis]
MQLMITNVYNVLLNVFLEKVKNKNCDKNDYENFDFTQEDTKKSLQRCDAFADNGMQCKWANRFDVQVKITLMMQFYLEKNNSYPSLDNTLSENDGNWLMAN